MVSFISIEMNRMAYSILETTQAPSVMHTIRLKQIVSDFFHRFEPFLLNGNIYNQINTRRLFDNGSI